MLLSNITIYSDIMGAGIIPEIAQNLEKMGKTKLTKIQEYVIPMILNHDKDIVAYSRTGHGKTRKLQAYHCLTRALMISVAYIMAIVSMYVSKNKKSHMIQKMPRVAILLQNHETANQVYENMTKIAQDEDFTVISAVGNVRRNAEILQMKSIGGDAVIATTGRFIDYVSENMVAIFT